MLATGAAEHLAAEQQHGGNGSGDPGGKVGQRVGGGAGEQQGLQRSGGQRENAAQRQRGGTEAEEIAFGRDAAADFVDIGKRLVEIGHGVLRVQTGLQRKAYWIANCGGRRAGRSSGPSQRRFFSSDFPRQGYCLPSP